MHLDHVGGLIDAHDQPVFPEARVLVPSGELDYWRGDIPEGAPEILTKQFQAAHRVIAAVGSRMQSLAGTEVLPGITRVPLPGHTPDHSGYRIVSGEDRILIWTDIVHLPGVQFPRPEATVAFDVDPPQAATTRRRIMTELAESRELVAGHHLDFPGIGYVADDGDGFRFLPYVWRPSVRLGGEGALACSLSQLSRFLAYGVCCSNALYGSFCREEGLLKCVVCSKLANVGDESSARDG